MVKSSRILSYGIRDHSEGVYYPEGKIEEDFIRTEKYIMNV